jgi:hypothetical protein
MNGDSTIEILLSVSVLALATGFASNAIQLPYHLVRSPIFVTLFVIATMASFSIFPMTGVAMFFLLAVILFSRNVETTRSRGLRTPQQNLPRIETVANANTPTLPPLPNPTSPTVQTHPVIGNKEVLRTGETVYGQTSIPSMQIPQVQPSSTFANLPRSVTEFQGTNLSHSLLGKMETSYKGMNAPPRVDIQTHDNHPTLPTLANHTSPVVNTHPVTERPEVLQTGQVSFGERSIPRQQIPVANGFYRFSDDHRSFKEFNETDSRNPVLGKIVESFVPSNYESSMGAPVEGMYPLHEQRAMSNPEPHDYTFRPAEDIGSNTFVPIPGPSIDRKKNVFLYNRNN